MMASDPPDTVFLPIRQIRSRYSVSSMSIWRWLHDPAVAFPQPVYFGRLRYWRLSDIEAWEKNRPTKKPAGGAE